jgi:hypothetical protein
MQIINVGQPIFNSISAINQSIDKRECIMMECPLPTAGITSGVVLMKYIYPISFCYYPFGPMKEITFGRSSDTRP